MRFILTLFQIFIWMYLPAEGWGSTKSDFQINDKIYVISTGRTSNKEDTSLETALKSYNIKFQKCSSIENKSVIYFIHRNIWKDIIKNQYSRAIIFEDNIKLENDFDKNFSLILKNLPTQFDVFFLDICLLKIGDEKTFFYPPSFWLSNFSNTTSSYYARVKHTNQIGSLHAYIVTYESAKKLLDLTTTISMPLDKTVILSNLNLFVSKTKLLSRKAITKRIQP